MRIELCVQRSDCLNAERVDVKVEMELEHHLASIGSITSLVNNEASAATPSSQPTRDQAFEMKGALQITHENSSNFKAATPRRVNTKMGRAS